MKSTTCRVRVALLGFQRGHKWRRIGGTVTDFRGSKSVAQYCIRCGENGWRIL